MTYNKTRAIRLTDKQVASLEALAAALDISGKGGARLNPLLAWLAETASGALAETAASLEIAAGCAAGGEWEDLVEVLEPKYPNE
jgi:hypothetical protein